jgi:hypothetical protein
MWIRVATKQDSVKYDMYGIPCVTGDHVERYYFEQDVADALEADDFLIEMWEEFDALFDWGDCDFFFPDKCERLIPWLENRLNRGVNDTIRPVYETMLDYAQKAVKYNTGIDFDF